MQTVVITGGSRGIGRAAVELFAARGDRVYFLYEKNQAAAQAVLAFFTPAAIPGLSIGCLLFNLTYSATLPLDFVVGTLATFLAAWGMWKTRNVLLGKLPVLGLTMPAITNAFLVGWELTQYIGGGFVINAVYVALGELAVVMVLGTMLYLAVKHRGLQKNMVAA